MRFDIILAVTPCLRQIVERLPLLNPLGLYTLDVSTDIVIDLTVIIMVSSRRHAHQTRLTGRCIELQTITVKPQCHEPARL